MAWPTGTSNIVIVRDTLYARIMLRVVSYSMVYDNVAVEKTHYPYKKGEGFEVAYPQGIVYVVAGVPGDMNAETRSNVTDREYPISVCFQRIVKPNAVASIDSDYLFMEQLEYIARKELVLSPYAFLRIEYLRDENDRPFMFYAMRESNLFEAIFTVFYKRAVT